MLLRPVFLTLKPLVSRLPPTPSTPHYMEARPTRLVNGMHGVTKKKKRPRFMIMTCPHFPTSNSYVSSGSALDNLEHLKTMKSRNLFLFSLLCVESTWAQSSMSSFVESDVPTGIPVAGDYRGALRPQVHFSPPKGFMVCFTHLLFLIMTD